MKIELCSQEANSMKTGRKRHWFFIHLLWFLIGKLVDSSSLSSSTGCTSVVSRVGEQVVLPCSWKPRLGERTLPTCHIQWARLANTVFEQRGEEKWEAGEFKGRVDVPEMKLGSGDCSLIINNVQIGDTGRYESFMVEDGVRSQRSRVFIQCVKLSVVDHKSFQSHRPGENLVLQLHTHHSVTVVFQGRNSSVWSVVWERGTENSERLEKHTLLEVLTIKNLKSADEGTYKVLDEQGLAVSTVQLSVEENSSPLRFHQRRENAPTDVASKSSVSALLILPVLVSSFQILHLL